MSVGLHMTEEQVAAILRRSGYRVAEPRKVRPMVQVAARQKKAAPRKRSEQWIDELVAAIVRAGHPEPAREFRFDAKRRYRFDLALHVAPPDGGVAIELDGVWGSGAHTLPTQAERDRRKDALALVRGWIVVRVTPSMVRDGTAAEAITHAVRMRTR